MRDEKQLLQKAAEGDDVAFKSLVLTKVDELTERLVAESPPGFAREKIEAIVQKAFIVARKELNRASHPPSDVSAWLKSIALNQLHLELVLRFIDGDRAAFEKLQVYHVEELRRLLSAGLGAELQASIDVDGIVQETATYAWNNRTTLEKPASFGAWLRRIGWRRLQDAIRRIRGRGRHRREFHELSQSFLADILHDRGSSPSDRAKRYELTNRIESALAELKPEYGRVLALRHLEGMSFKETAERMQRSVKAVEALHQRALRKLRDLMGPEADFFTDTA